MYLKNLRHDSCLTNTERYENTMVLHSERRECYELYSSQYRRIYMQRVERILKFCLQMGN